MKKKYLLIITSCLLSFTLSAHNIIYYNPDPGIKKLVSQLDKLSKSPNIVKYTPPKPRPREYFVKPLSLQNQVEFWTKIYSFYDSNEVVFHDQQDPRIIYSVLELPKIQGELSASRFKSAVQKRYQEIEAILDSIEREENQSSVEAMSIYKTLKNYKLHNNPDLKKRLRCQSGLKSQFALGLKNSGRYIDDMTAILRAHKLPEELVVLVFVESLFFLAVTSHAGASGPWGIMRETALLSGIYVNNFADERLDPVMSTWAAAQFLKKAKEGLGEWPLAITAYNYGYPGMLRATANLGTQDIEEIIAKHESPIFGFASKNYYAEFLAALEVYNQRDELFPDVRPEKPWRYELVQVSKPVEVGDIISARTFSKDEFAKLNPSLSKRTINNQEVIPPSYVLRVPLGKAKNFYARLKQIPAAKRKAAEAKISTKYRSNGKESLTSIAKKHVIRLDFLTQKFGEPALYCPKGTINIRSQAHLFSPLKDLSEPILAVK